MRPKSLEECVKIAITIGPTKEIVPRIRNELQDYFAHEIMSFSKNLKREDQLLLIKFFEFIFKKEK